MRKDVLRSVEDEIKSYALKSGALVVGIASVEDICRYAPKGHQPTDILNGAKSIVVVGGGKLPAGAWRNMNPRITGIIGFAESQTVDRIASQIARFIEDNYGYYAVSAPSGTVAGLNPFISLKLCAEMAGLGTRSLAAGIILNPEYGLLHYTATITTLPLKPDGPLSKPVCPHPSCVKMWEARRTTRCLEACPTCLSGELEDGKIKWRQYRRQFCHPRAYPSVLAFQRMILDTVNEPDPEKRKMMILGSFFTRIVRSIAYTTESVGQCFECVRRCPIGMKHRVKR